MNKNIFITGAEGFVGSHLLEQLAKNGNYNIKALVLYNFKSEAGWLNAIDKRIIRNTQIIMGDIRDYDFILKHTKNSDIVVNLAALIGIPYSYDAPKSYIDTNIIGTYNILQASLKNNVQKVIQTSTSEVYGNINFSEKFSEKSFQYAQSPYAATKISSDQLSNSYFSSFDLPVTILRPFNTYGPRQSERAIIPTVINQILNNQKKLKLGNLYASRDLNYIKDTIQGFIKVINSNKKIAGESFNIGSGFKVTINDLVIRIKKLMNSNIEVSFDKSRARPKKSEVEGLLCNSNKAKNILNWKPKYAGSKGLNDGLKETINWFIKNKKNYIFNKSYIK